MFVMQSINVPRISRPKPNQIRAVRQENVISSRTLPCDRNQVATSEFGLGFVNRNVDKAEQSPLSELQIVRRSFKQQDQL